VGLRRGLHAHLRALAERAREFDALPAVQEALAATGTPELGEATTTAGAEEADALKSESAGLEELAQRGYANEALDQLLVEVLLGLRRD
jgi:xylose isomerase